MAQRCKRLPNRTRSSNAIQRGMLAASSAAVPDGDRLLRPREPSVAAEKERAAEDEGGENLAPADPRVRRPPPRQRPGEQDRPRDDVAYGHRRNGGRSRTATESAANVDPQTR